MSAQRALYNNNKKKRHAEVVSVVHACVCVRCTDSATCVRVDGVRWLTRAAAHVLRHDAAEVPEARLAAVALLAAHAGFAGALAGRRVTRALVGAVDVALAGTCG